MLPGPVGRSAAVLITICPQNRPNPKTQSADNTKSTVPNGQFCARGRSENSKMPNWQCAGAPFVSLNDRLPRQIGRIAPLTAAASP